MDEPIFSEFSDEFTATFQAFCQGPAPAPASISELDRQLLLRHQALFLSPAPPMPAREQRHPFSGLITRRRWLYAVLALLVMLCAALLAIGPQRVIAQIQFWLGYLPGAGFINPAQTRVLAAPVEARQGNATLQVEQVIAGPEKTVVVVKLHITPEEINLQMQWTGPVTLILPDGQRLHWQQAGETNSAGELSAELEYPPLPDGVLQVTLEMPKLPIVSEDAQEFWSVILPLTEVRQAPNNAGQGTALPGIQAIAPYTPKIATASNQGVTVRLLQVAHSAQETGVLLQIEWSDPTWEYQYSGVELRDDRGHVYTPLSSPPGTNNPSNGTRQNSTSVVEMLRFTPLDPGVQQVTLTVEAVSFTMHAQAQFQFDPGDHPNLDQTWSFAGDPAKHMEIAGFQLQIMQTDFTYSPASDQPQVVNPPEATLLPQPTPLPPFACRLRLLIQITQQPQAHLFVNGLSLADEDRYPSGASSTDNANENIYLDLPKMPAKPLTVQLNDFNLTLQGGWGIKWDVPK